MKFLRGLFYLFFAKSGIKSLKKRIINIIDGLAAVLAFPRGCTVEVN
jgi:hypothetical protein